MNAAIVDTDIVSMLFKGDTRVLAYRPHITGRLLGISFMTLAELDRWSLERNWGHGRKLELAQHLTRYTVLPASRELCAKWAEVAFAAREKDVQSKQPTPGSRPVPCTIRYPSSPTIGTTTRRWTAWPCSLRRSLPGNAAHVGWSIPAFHVDGRTPARRTAGTSPNSSDTAL
jgi:predicted nucleic acid-binding protein